MANFIEEMSPRRGLKASSCVGNHYRLDTDMPCGIVVVPGASDGTAKVPSSGAEVLTALGALVYPVADVAASATLECEAGLPYEIVAEGDVWMVCETAMAKGTIPYVRFTAGVGEQAGALRNDADTADAAVLPNARVLTTASGAGLVKVRFNLPGAAS